MQITKIRYLCFDLVSSRYTRMAGFRRREIEDMQALCINNIYIECYFVGLIKYMTKYLKEKHGIQKKSWSFVRSIQHVPYILSTRKLKQKRDTETSTCTGFVNPGFKA